jgi:hypothetical protein
MTERDGDGERESLGLTLEPGSLPSSLQSVGATPLLVGSAGMLPGDANGLQCSHLGSKLAHNHDSVFVSLEDLNNVNQSKYVSIM